jgi:hypothetical protein
MVVELPEMKKELDGNGKKIRDVRRLPAGFYEKYKVFDDRMSTECIYSFHQIGMSDPFSSETYGGKEYFEPENMHLMIYKKYQKICMIRK